LKHRLVKNFHREKRWEHPCRHSNYSGIDVPFLL